MTTITTNLNSTNKIDLIRTMSIRHKQLCFDESIHFNGNYLNDNFILLFRNYRKQRYLIFTHSTGIIEYDNCDKYITGHDFIKFINRCFDAMEGKNTLNLYTVIFDWEF